MMNRKNIFQAISITIITILLAWFLKKHFHQIRQALSIKPLFLIGLVLLNIANKFLLGLKVRKVASVFGKKLPFTAWFGSVAINNFYNYLAPKSGTILAGVYLKNKHGLDYKKYVSLVITTFIITILTCGVLGTLASIYAYKAGLTDNLVFLVIFLLLTAAPLVLFFIPRIHFKDRRILQKANEFLEGWHILRRDKDIILVLSSLDAMVILLVAGRYFLLFKMLSLNVVIVKCLLLAPFNIITHVSTIIPAGYGIKEAVVGLLSRLINVEFVSGVLATLSDRVVGMLVSFIIGPIFSFTLFKHIFISGKERNANAKL